MSRLPPRLNRRPHRREPRKRFTIFCEGLNTEPLYFRELARVYENAMLVIEPIGGVGEPRAIAEAAIQRLKENQRRRKKSSDSFEEHDEVWVVFDRDEHPYFEAAIRMCEVAGIPVGRSNPCFEVWLILHLSEYDRPDHRHDCQAYLRRLHPAYDPNRRKTADCAGLVSEVERAEQRAARQLAARANEGLPYNAPSTTVGKLTAAIREASQKAKKY